MSTEAWLQQAESDLAAANLLSVHACHSQAIWFAAQAVEKAHKAILNALGMRYQDKHYIKLGHGTSEIANLLPEALHELRDPQIAVMVSTLEQRGNAARYPARSQTSPAGQIVAPATSMTSSQKEVQDAEMLLAWCRARVERALKATQAMRP